MHGQALATERFAQVGEHLGNHVRRLDTSATSAHRSLRYLASRTKRTLVVAANLISARKTRPAVHLGVDADAGLPITVALALVSAAMGLATTFHHHSFRYIVQPRTSAKVGFKLLGSRASHVVTCEKMAAALRSTYGANLDCKVVSVGHAISADPVVDRPIVSTPKTIGTLGNLGSNKGLDVVIETFERLGGEFELRLGGPAADIEAQALIDRAVSKDSTRVRYDGAVFGEDKAKFLAGLDCFLFPSRHRDESFGLVVLEALRAGVPVIMVANPCFGQAELGGAGIAISIDEFSRLACEQISEWVLSSDSYVAAQNAALAVSSAHIESASSAVRNLWQSGQRAVEN